MRFVLSILAFCVLTACTATMNQLAGIGQLTESKSSFDNATVITLTPAWLYNQDQQRLNSITLGAEWNSKVPNHVILILESQGIVGLTEISVNIDGTIIKIDANRSTDFDIRTRKGVPSKSSNRIAVKSELVEQMMAAKDCRIRINTTQGYEDSHFHILHGNTSDTAKVEFAKFLEKVKVTRAHLGV